MHDNFRSEEKKFLMRFDSSLSLDFVGTFRHVHIPQRRRRTFLKCEPLETPSPLRLVARTLFLRLFVRSASHVSHVKTVLLSKGKGPLRETNVSFF